MDPWAQEGQWDQEDQEDQEDLEDLWGQEVLEGPQGTPE